LGHLESYLLRNSRAWSILFIEGIMGRYPEQQLAHVYVKQVTRLEALRDCLVLERENLINLDLNGLWRLVERKHDILTDLEAIENEIKTFPHEEDSTFKPDSQRFCLNLFNRASQLKKEIKTRNAENRLFIQDVLGFIDELMSIFAGRVQEPTAYGKVSKSQKKTQPVMIYREV
jgi:flagellar biosynthesis/type III secretory pathway chaperone